MTFSKRLRFLRKKRNMTPKDLADIFKLVCTKEMSANCPLNSLDNRRLLQCYDRLCTDNPNSPEKADILKN